MEFDLKDFDIEDKKQGNQEEEEQGNQKEFSLSDFGIAEPKTEKELAIQKDDIFSKKMEQLNLNLEDKTNKIDNLIKDEDEKEFMKKSLNVQYELKRKEEEEKAYDNFIKKNKQAPDISNATNEQEETSGLYKSLKGIEKGTSNFYKSLKDFEEETINMVDDLTSPALELALHLSQKFGNAIGQTIEGGVNLITQGKSDLDFYSEQKDRLKLEGERIVKKIDPNNKLSMKPTDVTELFASIAIPFKITNTKALYFVESLIGYVIEMSDSGDFLESVKKGFTQGSIAGSANELANTMVKTFTKSGATKTLNYLWEAHNIEMKQAAGLDPSASKDSVIKAIEDRWLNIMSGESSNENKVRAIIDSLGKTGAEYKVATQQVVEKSKESIVRQAKEARVADVQYDVAGQNITDATKTLVKEVGTGIKGAESLADDSIKALRPDGVSPEVYDRALSKFTKKIMKGDIDNLYGDVSAGLKNKYTDIYNIDTDALKGVSSELEATVAKGGTLNSAETNLSKALESEMTIDNLLLIKKEVSALTRNSSGTQLTNANKLKKNVDSILKNTLSKQEYNLLSKMDKEYVRKIAVRNSGANMNKLGAKLMDYANGGKTIENITEDLASLNVASTDFKEIEKIIGTNNVAKIEKSIVNDMLNKNIDDVSWETMSKTLKNIGFISKEGKALKSVIDEYSKVFSADNFTNIVKINLKDLKDSDNASALTFNLITKLQYAASSNIFKLMKKKLYITKDMDEIRAIEDVANILSGKKLSVKNRSISKDDAYEVVRESVKSAYKQQINQLNLESKPTEQEIDVAVDKGMSNLGLDAGYGGKATRVNNSKDNGDYLKSLYNTKEEQEEVAKVVDTYGIKSSDKPTKAKSNYDKGAKEWFASLTNKQKEEVVETIEVKKDRTKGYNLSSLYEDGLTKYKKANNNEPSYSDISDSMFGTKKEVEVSKEGNLGMTSSYGGKATGSGVSLSEDTIAQLNSYTSGKVSPKENNASISELVGKIKEAGIKLRKTNPRVSTKYQNMSKTLNKIKNKSTLNKEDKEKVEEILKEFTK